MWNDLRHALRMLSKTPGFAAVAILTLALGIGANAAIFSVVNAVLLQPFPFDRADRLFFINENSRQRNLVNGAAAADFLDWQSQTHSFAGMAAVSFIPFTYSEHGGAVRVNGAAVSNNYFELLGVRPILGRTFLAEEDQPGFDAVAVISEAFWRRSFAADPLIAGKIIRLNSRQYHIVGVVPDAANLVSGPGDIWKPLGWNNATRQDRASRLFGVFGRLRDGVSAERADEELRAVSQWMGTQYPATNTDWTAQTSPVIASITGGPQKQLLLLLAVAGVVLLIACVNLASLFSARMSARHKEIATRLAIGASRGRLLRNLLAEGLLLSLAGGLLGAVIASRAQPLLAALLPNTTRIENASFDAATLAFTVLISVAAGLLFGLAPAYLATRMNVHGMLQDNSRGSSRGAGRNRFLDGLLISEIALSMLLLVGAGLFLRTFTALRSVDPGFKAEGVLVNTLLVLPQDKYDTTPKRIEFFARLLDRVRALPGVRSAGGITALPLQNNSGTTGYRVAGDADTVRGRERGAVLNVVTDSYFETMSIPLLRGRSITAADHRLSRRVAVVNEALVKHDFKDRDPIGQQLVLPGQSLPAEIVGVVGSSRQANLRTDPQPEIFIPFLQSNAGFMYLLVRSSGPPENLAMPIRREVAAIDPDQPVGHRTLEQQIGNAIAQPRRLAETLGLFAGLALILALVGIYGVTSYGVAQRTQEIGIRAALGARPAALIGMVLGRTARLALAGVAAGAFASFFVTGAIRQFLFGVTADDPLTFLYTAAVLLAVAMGASCVPALRASRVDAIIAMRHE